MGKVPFMADVKNLAISSDNQHVAYAAWRNGKAVIVVDGLIGPEHDAIGPGSLVFSPDSQHLAYLTARGAMQFVVIDGQETQEYEAVWPLFFDGPNRIRFVATGFDELFNRELLRVEIEIVEEQR